MITFRPFGPGTPGTAVIPYTNTTQIPLSILSLRKKQQRYIATHHFIFVFISITYLIIWIIDIVGCSSNTFVIFQINSGHINDYFQQVMSLNSGATKGSKLDVCNFLNHINLFFLFLFLVAFIHIELGQESGAEGEREENMQ